MAPNGARKTRQDHPALPITPAELAACAAACRDAGASMLHLHVRQALRSDIEGIAPSLYPRMHSYLDPQVGVNLRFREKENRKQRRRRTAGLFLEPVNGG